jgi:hypothetical protein
VPATARIEKAYVYRARVAELADALDSGLHFGRFLPITLHCFNNIKTIDFITQNRIFPIFPKCPNPP